MIITPFSRFTRPANTTQYADGDLISETTSGQTVPLRWATGRIDGSGSIKAVRLYKTTTTATAADFILRLFGQDPEISIADNAALTFTDHRYSLGGVDLDMTTGGDAGSASLWKRFVLSSPIQFDAKSFGTKDALVYGFLEADGTYTPGSEELFEIILEIGDQ